MPRVIKPSVIIFLSLVINTFLFLLIHQLVSNDLGALPKYEKLNWIDFVKLESEPEDKKQEQIKPEEPPPPEETPPQPELARPDITKPEQINLKIPVPEINVPLAVDGTPYLGDYLTTQPKGKLSSPIPEIATNVVPTTRIEPVYPPRALRAGIEGSVTVEFTITTDGSVRDITVIKSEPSEIFDQAVLQAVKRWKFAPEIVDGNAVEKRARQDIKFTLKR